MDRRELAKELRALAKAQNVSFRVDEQRGKGSHARIFFGDQVTTCPKKVSPAMAKVIKHQLGISD